MINEGTEFKIHCKTKLNILKKFLSINSTSRVKENARRGINLANIPRFETDKFSGDSTQRKSFYNSFNAAVGQSTSLTNTEKFNYLRTSSHSRV